MRNGARPKEVGMSSRRVGTAVFSLLLAALVFLPTFPVLAQTPVTPTVFASGFFEPSGTAFSADGTLYVADRGTGTIQKVDTQGNVTPFTSGLFGPAGIAFDRSGNLYVANTFQGAIVRIAPDGTKSTFASGLSLQFFAPLAFDRLGDLFVGVSGKVVRITPAGEKFDFVIGFDTYIGGIAFDGAGNLFISEFFSGRIFRATPDGTLSLFFNLQTPFGFLAGAESLAFDINGNLYVANGLPLDFFSKGVVYKINASGTSAEELTTRDLAGPSYLAFGVGALTGQLLFSNDGTFHFPPPLLAQTVATANVGVAGLPLLGEPPELSSIRITPASFIFETGGMKTFQAEAVSQDGFSLGPVSVKWGLTNDHPQNVVTAPGLQNSGNWFKNPDGSFYVASNITLEAGQEIGSATLKAQFARQGGSNLDATAALQVVEDVGEVAFTVTDISPANGQVNVKRTATVSATFTKPIDPLSVTGASFFLKDSDGAPISAGISFSADLRTAFLEPSSALPFGETVTLTLKGQTPINGGGGQGQGGPQFFGIQDLDGNFLAGDLTSSFTTIFPPGHGGGNPSDGPGGIGNPPGSGGEPTPPPPIHVVAISPPNGGSAGLQSVVRVTFSEAVQPSTVNSSTFKVIGAGQLGGTYSFEDENRTAVFTASLPFSDPVITVQLTSGILGVSGGELIPFTSSFSVIAIEMGIILDTTGSMSQLPLVTQQIAAFANSMVQSGVPGLRIGVVTFGDAFNTVAEEAEFDLDPRPRFNLVNVTQPSGLQALQSFLGTLSPVDGGDGLENDLGALNFAHNSGGLSFTSGSARCFLVITDNNAHTPQTAQFVRSQRTGEIIGIGAPWTPPEPSSLLSTLIGRAPVNVLNRVTGGGFNMANAALLTGGKSRNVNDLFFIPLDQMGFRCNPAEFAIGPNRQPSDDVFISPFEGAGPSDSPFGFRIRIPSGLTQGLGFVPTLTVRSFFDPLQGPDVRTLSLSPGPGGFHETQVLFLTERGPTGGNVIRGAVGGSLEVRIDGTALLQTVGLEKRGFEVMLAEQDPMGNFTGNLVPSTTSVIDCDPFPTIQLNAVAPADVTIQNGQATLVVSGCVLDPIADIATGTGADITSVQIELPDGTVQMATVSRVSEPSSIVRPNAFRGEFQKQVTFTIDPNRIEHAIVASTSGNALGNTGSASLILKIEAEIPVVPAGPGFFDRNVLSVIVVMPFTANERETILAFAGFEEDIGEGEPPNTMLETGNNTFVFTGSPPNLGSSQLRITSFSGLNPGVNDTMSVELTSGLLGTHTLILRESDGGTETGGWFASDYTTVFPANFVVRDVVMSGAVDRGDVNYLFPRLLIPVTVTQATLAGQVFQLRAIPGFEGKFLDKVVIFTEKDEVVPLPNVLPDPSDDDKIYSFGTNNITVPEARLEYVRLDGSTATFLQTAPADLINAIADPAVGSNDPLSPQPLSEFTNPFARRLRLVDRAIASDVNELTVLLTATVGPFVKQIGHAMQRVDSETFESVRPILGTDGPLNAQARALLQGFDLLDDDREQAKTAGGKTKHLRAFLRTSSKFQKRDAQGQFQDLLPGEVFLRGQDVGVELLVKADAGVELPNQLAVILKIGGKEDGRRIDLPQVGGVPGKYAGVIPGEDAKSTLLPKDTPNDPLGQRANDAVNEIATGDLVEDREKSNFEDSRAIFGEFRTQRGYEDRGQAETKVGEEFGDKHPLYHYTLSALQAAGTQPFELVLPAGIRLAQDGAALRARIQNQANIFYYSGHGYHDSASIVVAEFNLVGGKVLAELVKIQPRLIRSLTFSHWNEDLDLVILAGCSVLDVEDEKDSLIPGFYTPNPTRKKPGQKWATTAPKAIFLGYRGRGPADKMGATAIAQDFAVRSRGKSGNDLILEWLRVNLEAGTRGRDRIESPSWRTATGLNADTKKARSLKRTREDRDKDFWGERTRFEITESEVDFIFDFTE